MSGAAAVGERGATRTSWRAGLPRVRIGGSTRPGIGIGTVVLGGGIGIAGILASQAGFAARAAVGGLGLIIFFCIVSSNRTLAFVAALAWLILLGFVRRALIPFIGWSNQDPLLLVGPVAAVAILGFSIRRDSPPPRTAMSTIVLLILLLSIAEVVNPNEAQVVTALQSLLFYFSPIAWFFVGQRLTAAEHDRALGVVFWLIGPVLILGLYQSYFGLLPFEYHWLGVSHQSAAIFLAGFKVRPFSTFTSPQEYGYYLAFAIILLLARLSHRPRHPVALSALLFVTVAALILQSSRTVFVFLLFALAVMSVVRTRSLITVLLVVASAAAIGVFAIHTDYAPGIAPPQSAVAAKKAAKQSLAANLFSHEFAGLTHPGQGTGPLHITLIVDGFNEGVHYPFGLGISHGSVASLKAGGFDQAEQAPVAGAENDIANVTAAAGLAAGVLLLAFIVIGTAGAFRLHRREPSIRHLVWIGMCIVSLTQWLSGSLYATSTLLFIALGGISRENADLARQRTYGTGDPDSASSMNRSISGEHSAST